MRFLDVIPLLVFIGLAVMMAVRKRFLSCRGIRAIAVTHDGPMAERMLKVASMLMFWLFALLVLLYAWDPSPAWLPSLLTYQVHDIFALRLLGAVLGIGAVAMYPVALTDMGDSWRIGIDRETHDASSADSKAAPANLVTGGLFALSRNPIYIIVDAIFFGAFLVHGQLIFLLVAIAYAIIVHREILDEERFLAARYGEEYAAYSRRVARYLM